MKQKNLIQIIDFKVYNFPIQGSIRCNPESLAQAQKCLESAIKCFCAILTGDHPPGAVVDPGQSRVAGGKWDYRQGAGGGAGT